MLRSLQPVQAGAKFGDLAILGLQSGVNPFGPDIHLGTPTSAGLSQGGIAVQPLRLEIEAGVDSGESFKHFASQRTDPPLQAFLHIDNQLFEVFHDTFIVHPVYLAPML